jgi:hypothetical protein
LRKTMKFRTKQQVIDWLRAEGLVLHHAGRSKILLVPTELHKGVRHSGWACILRKAT